MFDCRKSFLFVVKVMRRYIFYLSAALLAFGVGSFVAGNLYQLNEVISMKNEAIALETVEKQGKTAVVSKAADIDEEEHCSGLSNDDSFEPAINKWTKGKIIEGKPMRPPEDYRSEGDEFVPSLIDINFDSKKELLIKSNCSPVNNCYLTLYKKTKRITNQYF